MSRFKLSALGEPPHRLKTKLKEHIGEGRATMGEAEWKECFDFFDKDSRKSAPKGLPRLFQGLDWPDQSTSEHVQPMSRFES